MNHSRDPNTHVWNRGLNLKVDFEHWERDPGCKSWGWEACLPFRNRVETDLDFGEDRRNPGRSGPIKVSRRGIGPGDPRSWRASDRAWYDACVAAGWKGRGRR